MEAFLSSETIEFEIQTDILTLLENVKCQGNNPSGLKQALLALATICSSGAVSQEYFYMAGGVEELKSLLLEGSCSLLIVPAALYCLGCAIRQNVRSQNAVLTEDMLTMIHELLSHTDSCDRLLQAAAFLLACTVVGSSKGQLMADEAGCLQDLVQLLRQCMTCCCEDENKWSVVTRAIGVCVNNPHNAHNQQTCCSVLPHTLKFISTEPRHKCVSHVFTLIGLVVANNVQNQDRIRKCGGIETLVQFITKQVSVDCISLSLLANAASAVNACIADNVESGIQAGNLGLVPVLLELLQERELESSHAQIFILTLAHLLESSSKFCQIVTEGKGYHILISVLTDSQDEELCKVIKYILTLCKNTENITHKNYIIDEENGDNLKHSSRDLTTFLKQGLSALSGQLSTIEKLSENSQWMKNVDTTNLSMKNNPEFQIDTPAEISNNGTVLPRYNMFGEPLTRAGNQNVLKQSKLDYMPHNINPVSSFNDNRVFQERRLAPPSSSSNVYHGQSSVSNDTSYVKDGMFIQDQEQLVLLDSSSRGGYFHEDGEYYVSSRLNTSRTIQQGNCAGTDNTNFHSDNDIYSIRLGEQTGATSSSHEQSSWDRIIRNGTTRNDVHTTTLPHYTTRDFANPVFNQGFRKPTAPLISDGLSGYRLQSISGQLGSAENGNSLLDNRSERETNVSIGKQIPNIDFLGQQDSIQVHNCTENGRYEHSQFCKERASKKHPNQEVQTPSQGRTIFSRAQSQQKDEQVLPNDLLGYTHHFGTVNEQYQEFNVNDCRRPSTHQRNTSENLGYMLREQTDMDCCRSNDVNVCSAPVFSAAQQATSLKSPSSQLNMQCIQQAHPVSTLCPTSLNSCSNLGEGFKPDGSPHENQWDLLSELQKMMSSFFKALFPGQANSLPAYLEARSKEYSTQLTDQDSLARPAVQTPNEQDLLHSDMSIHSSAASENILSLCEENYLPEENIHQQILSAKNDNQTFSTKQSEKDEASNVGDNQLSENMKENISAVNKSELGNISGIQNIASTQEASSTCISDNVEGGSSEKVVTSFHEYTTFAKPSQLPPCRSQAHKANKLISNIRLTSTPLTAHISTKTPENQHQPPPSPALSQFDNNLRRMAHLGHTDCSKTAATITQKALKSTSECKKPTSKCKSTPTILASRNMATNTWSVSNSNSNQVVDENLIANQPPPPCAPISKHHSSVEGNPLPLYRRNVPCLVKTHPLLDMDKYFQPIEKIKTVGNPYKTAAWIKKTYHGVSKGLDQCNPDDAKNPLCPGCTAGFNLNSYTYNIAIETCVNTCVYHRTVRQCEREYIRQQLNNRSSMKRSAKDDDKHESISLHDVYDYQSDNIKLTSSPRLEASRHNVTSARQGAKQEQDDGREVRRPRVLYSQQELLNLLDGVATMGKRWQQILCTYQFHPSRTAVDLKDKYKQLKIKEKQEQQMKTERPFSMCEVRRLKNGVKHLGYNWKAILKGYRFLPGRTAEDLHKQWKSLNQPKVQ